MRFTKTRGRSNTPQLNVLDLRKISSEPVSAAYLSRNRAFLLDVPISQCSGLIGASLEIRSDVDHPYVRTALEILAGHCSNYEESSLHKFYTSFQPKNAADALGIEIYQSSSLQQFPPHARVLPWDTMSVKKKSETYIKRVNTGGTSVFGPVSREKGRLEYNRIRSLLDSISKTGYYRTNEKDGDIVVHPLLSTSGSIRYEVTNGAHRVAVLSALRIENVTVRINHSCFARENEAAFWPQVQNGTFKQSEAVHLFRNMFNCIPPWKKRYYE